MNTQTTVVTRQAILDQLAALSLMQRGTVSEQYFERPAPDGKASVRLGPYYKFQIWREGRNQTRSLTAGEAATLRQDIENYHLFEQLCRQLAQLNIEYTLAVRSAGATADVAAAEKKTSRRSVSPKGTAKPRPSSTKRGRSSPGKG